MDIHGFAGCRLREDQMMAMQKRPVYVTDDCAAITAVANDRRADCCQLMANLVVSTGDQLQLEESILVGVGHGPKSA